MLPVRDIFKEVMLLYRSQARVLIPLAFWLYLAVAILNGLAPNYFQLDGLSGFEELTTGEIVLALMAVGVNATAGTIYFGLVAIVVGFLKLADRNPSRAELAHGIVPVLLTLLAAGFLSYVGILIGFALLIVPGFVALTYWAVIAPVIVIERHGELPAFDDPDELGIEYGLREHLIGVFFAAFRRSVELVRGGEALVVWFFVMLGGALVAGSQFLAKFITTEPLVHVAITALCEAFAAPVQGLIVAVIYFRLLKIEGTSPHLA